MAEHSSVVLANSGVVEVAFSQDQQHLYVATTGGDIRTYNVASKQLLSTWHVGTRLGGISVSDDGSFLLAVERSPATGLSTLHRVSTLNGAVTDISIAGPAFYDVEIVNSNTAIVTGQNYIQSLSLATGQFSSLLGSGYGVIVEDGRYSLLAGPGTSEGPLYVYDDVLGRVVSTGNTYQSPYTGFNWGSQAISEAAGRIAQFVYYGTLNIYDLNVRYLTSVNVGGRVDGIIFAESGRYAYVNQIDAGQVIEYRTSDWTEVARFAVGSTEWHNNIGYGSQLLLSEEGRYLTVSDTSNLGRLQIVDLAIKGTSGADVLIGTADDDIFVIDHVGDTIIEAQSGGIDKVLAALDAYTLPDNVENLTGTAASDQWLAGNALANVIESGSGNDRLTGEAGNDLLRGGDGRDLLQGGDGGDILEGDGGADSLASTTVDDFGYGDDAALDIDRLYGGDGDDAITAGVGDIIDGGSGIDQIFSWNLEGGTAGVTISISDLGSAAGVDVLGGHVSGIEVISQLFLPNFANKVSLAGQPAGNGSGLFNQPFVRGGNVADWLIGSDGYDGDFLSGADGDDIIEGRGGNDTIFGGNGDDRLLGGAGADYLLGDAGNDTVSFVGSAASVAVNLLTRTGSKGDAAQDTYDSIENVIGTAFSDTIFGDKAVNTLNGGNGDDSLSGDGGNDKLYGDGGNDILTGGIGNDALDGGAGRDIMSGGVGDDIYQVDNSFDQVIELAGGGRDLIVTKTMNVTLSDNVENLLIMGASARTGTGNGLANKMTGGNGGDTLYGLGGNDILIGGMGDDSLWGGAGADIFQYLAFSDASASDHIRDFNAIEGDRVDLGVLDGKSQVTGNNRFDWIGTAAFSHHEGELRYQIVGSSALLTGDVDGDGRGDFSIVFSNTASLAADYFIL